MIPLTAAKVGDVALDERQRTERILRTTKIGVFKTLNTYATAVPEYNHIPKAVWAAIAVSALTCGGDQLAEARKRVLNEWAVLHANKIVPQKPPKVA